MLHSKFYIWDNKEKVVNKVSKVDEYNDENNPWGKLFYLTT